jgi:hypothetical protein
MRIATLVCWALTASLGGFMLRSWLASGGLRRERARAGGLPPQLIFGHMGLALTGLAVWIGYTFSGTRALCWTAVAILTAVIALGICTVTLWTPYTGVSVSEEPPPAPASRPPPPADAGFTLTDEMIEQFLTDPFPGSTSSRLNLTAIIPVAHGLAAIATFVLAVMTTALT